MQRSGALLWRDCGSAAQIAEIRSIFDLYDSDGSGSIDKEELIEAMSATGYPESNPGVES